MSLERQFRSLMTAALGRVRSKSEIGLLLSGGYDSACVLGAARSAGLKVKHAFTVTFGEYDTDDALLAAKRAKTMPDVEHHMIRVARTDAAYEESVSKIITYAGSVLKTAIENAVLIAPVARIASEAGCDVLLNGMAGDDLWGTNRKSCEAMSSDGDAGFSYARMLSFGWTHVAYPQTSTRLCAALCEDAGIAWTDPFESIEVAEWLLRRSQRELHGGGMKALGVAAFPDEFSCGAKKASMQIESGVRGFAEIVASEKGFNTPIGWYNALARQLSINPSGSKESRRHWASRVDYDRVNGLIEMSERLKRDGVVLRSLDDMRKPNGEWEWI